MEKVGGPPWNEHDIAPHNGCLEYDRLGLFSGANCILVSYSFIICECNSDFQKCRRKCYTKSMMIEVTCYQQNPLKSVTFPAPTIPTYCYSHRRPWFSLPRWEYLGDDRSSGVVDFSRKNHQRRCCGLDHSITYFWGDPTWSNLMQRYGNFFCDFPYDSALFGLVM